MAASRLALVASLAAATVAVSVPLDAHKPITSKYTYNAEVYPILKARCGACHAPGGAGPMSLLDYKAAVPWAESVREELVAERMPPSFVDPLGPGVKGARAISPQELDTIITWATGGTPEGDAARRPSPAAASSGWSGGAPDLELPVPEDHTLTAEVQEETAVFAIDTGFARPTWIRGADLLPGYAPMVRDATIAVDGGPVLAIWEPGAEPVMAPDGAAFLAPAGATLSVRVHYKKSWEDERQTRTDRSRIGLYFASAGPAIESIPQGGRTPAAASVVAVRARVDQPYGSLAVDAVTSEGERIPLLRLHDPQPQWPARYWLKAPVALPANAHIETSATPAPVDPDAPPKPSSGAVDVGVDFVRR
jgi:hypothetical protein